MNYQQTFDSTVRDPAAFWLDQARGLDWFVPPRTGLSTDAQGVSRWFADGVLNTAHLALDVHVTAGNGERTALIYDSPVTGARASYSYRALRDAVALCSGMLRDLGVGKGDRVLLYMPMIPEAVIAMLACARLGAVHCVVFGGFAAHELAVRIDDCAPKVVLSASCGIEVDRVIPYQPILSQALKAARHRPERCVILQRPQCAAPLHHPRDLDWHEQLAAARPADCVPVAATDPLYILYTSGTTGKPKGIVRDNGGHAVAMGYSMATIYNMAPGEVFWAASDVGWVVGHSYIVYGPLISGCTTVLYEGKPVRTPDAGAFWRVVAEYGVKALFAAPTAFRAIRKEDPEASLAARHDLSSLQYLFLAGERLDPPTYQWLAAHLGRPVLDHWWQTETGWAIAANPIGIEAFATRPGSATLPVPGFDVHILDDNGAPLGPHQKGNICVKLPLPPGCLATVWNNHPRYEAGYMARFPGYYLTGDGGYRDEDGYLFVMGRTDDVINVAGHRLSTGEMEEVVAAHPAVAECVVIGIADGLRGQVPLALAVLKDGMVMEETALEAEVVLMVREQVGALACLRQVLMVRRLPKTRSGKILRAILRKLADGEGFEVPSTIDDPTVLDEIRGDFARRGIGPGA
ncbi:MAG: propionyl-CoA synthetase [Pseudomonadota bacterium]|nr:propionyl-CoA synthetase [Pseudomonadota bacterium]